MKVQGRRHLEALEHTVSLAKQVLPTEDAIRDWLTTPATEWGGRSPMRVIVEGEGQLVLNFLSKKDYEKDNTAN
jgi:hypothetical protein